jgi:hypothetical protein
MSQFTIKSGLPQMARSFSDFASLVQKQVVLPAGANQIEDITLKLYGRTVKTWRRKPRFSAQTKFKNSEVVINAGTDDKVWNIINRGARPHIIRAKNAPRLRFQTGYTAKTKVRDLHTGPGGAFGPIRFAMAVNHPGIKARQFDQEIKESLDLSVPILVDKHYQKRIDKRFKRTF